MLQDLDLIKVNCFYLINVKFDKSFVDFGLIEDFGREHLDSERFESLGYNRLKEELNKKFVEMNELNFYSS